MDNVTTYLQNIVISTVGGEKAVTTSQQISDAYGKQDKHTKRLKNNNLNYFKTAVRGIALWGLATAAIYGTLRALKELTTQMLDVEYNTAEIKVVTGELNSTYDTAITKMYELSTVYGVAATEISTATKIWAQQGIGLKASLELMNTTLMGVNVTGMTTNSMVEALTAGIKSFNIDTSQSVTILDKWIKSATVAAIDVTTLAEAMKVSAETAGIMGISIDRLNGLVVALGESTRISGTQIGTAFKTIAPRMFRPQAVKAMEETGGVEMFTDSSRTQFRDLSDILDDLSTKWESMSRSVKIYLVQQVTGVRQGNLFISMMNHYDRALEVTVESLMAQGMAAKSNNIIMDTSKKRFAAIRAELVIMGTESLKASGAIEFLIIFFKGLAGTLRAIKSLLGGTNKSAEELTQTIRGLSLGVFVLTAGITAMAVAIGMTVNPWAAVILMLTSAITLTGTYVKSLAEIIEKEKALNASYKERLNSEYDLQGSLAGLLEVYNNQVKQLSTLKEGTDAYNKKLLFLEKLITMITSVNKPLGEEISKTFKAGKLQPFADALVKIQNKMLDIERQRITFDIKISEGEIEKLTKSLDDLGVGVGEAPTEALSRLKTRLKETSDKVFALSNAIRLAYGDEVRMRQKARTEGGQALKDSQEYNTLLYIQQGLKKTINNLSKEEVQKSAETLNNQRTSQGFISQKLKVALANVGVNEELLNLDGDIYDKQKEIYKSAQDIYKEWKQLQNTIQDTIVNGLDAIITRTGTWQDMLSNLGGIIRKQILENLVESSGVVQRMSNMIAPIFGGVTVPTAGSHTARVFRQTYGDKKYETQPTLGLVKGLDKSLDSFGDKFKSTLSDVANMFVMGQMGGAASGAMGGRAGGASNVGAGLGGLLLGTTLTPAGGAFVGGLIGGMFDRVDNVTIDRIEVDNVELYAKRVVPVGWMPGQADITPRVTIGVNFKADISGVVEVTKKAVVNDLERQDRLI